MEMEGEGAFQISALKDEDRCIYLVMVSQIFPMVSLTSITIERACCLYALLTETFVDFSSFVIATMKGARMADQIIGLPYGVLITGITEHARVSIEVLTEIPLSKEPITS
jgi:hypothetical protein